MTLRKRTIIGVLWNFAEQLSRRGITVLVTLTLAFFLTPEDFGLIGMMAIFIAVSTSFMDSGFKEALIRRKNATQSDYSTIFYANLALGAIAYGTLFLVAPWIADFYEEPRLTGLIRALGLVVIINSFQVVQVAILSRALDFKAQLQATVPAALASGCIAIACAYAGFGVWALVAQILSGALVTTVLLSLITKWRPTTEIDNGALLEMYDFGYRLFLSGMINTIFKNIYVVVIAKTFMATAAGHYFFADRVRELLLYRLVSAIQRVTYPALASIEDDDVRLKAGYRRVIQLTCFLLFPGIAIMTVLVDPVFRSTLPNAWLPAVPMLQLMCISAMMHPINSINLNILKVKGRSDLILYLEIVKKVVLLIVLFVTINYGVLAIVAGQILVAVLSYFPNAYYSFKLINYSMSQQIRDYLPGLILSSAVVCLVYILSRTVILHPLIEIIMLSVGAGILYLFCAMTFRMKAFFVMMDLFRGKVGGNVK